MSEEELRVSFCLACMLVEGCKRWNWIVIERGANAGMDLS